jgi:uncharacterized protein
MGVVAKQQRALGCALVAALGVFGSAAPEISGVGVGVGVAAALDVPALQARVTDIANVLSGSDRNQLEQKLANYEQRTGHQFAVLLIPSLEGESLEEYSMRVVETWRLGDKRRDDGLLVLLALQERMIRIEVGYGLEGAVPDALTARVREQYMVPAFRRGDFSGGLNAGLEALIKAAEGEAVEAPTSTTSLPDFEVRRETMPWVVGLLLFVNVVLQRLARPVRVVLGGVIGAALGYWAFQVMSAIVVFAILGAVFGLLPLLFHVRPNGRQGRWRGRWRGGRGGGFGGGFRGGGGGFGGGGSSGKW